MIFPQIINHYVKITLLDLNDQPIQNKNKENIEISGIVKSGNISLNGDSAVRRTANLSLVANESINKVTEVENLISINKRIRLSVGIQDASFAEEQEIHWYDLGIFQITNAPCSYNNQGINISLSLKDKMCLVNGECGGTILGPTIHSPLGDENEDGSITLKPVLFKKLIPEVLKKFTEIEVNEDNIDINEKIDNRVRWIGANPVYGITLAVVPVNTANGNKEIQIYTLVKEPPFEQDISTSQYDIYSFNDDIGYQTTDYVWPTSSDLESRAGEAVTSVLDKIKNQLGNFEYFFDKNGDFHFQEIQNGINQGSEMVALDKAIADKYLVEKGKDEPVYIFDDSNLITAYQNNPQYGKIKNDIVAWGEQGDSKLAIRYHLLIDSLDTDKFPAEKSFQNCQIYTDQAGVKRVKDKGESTIIAKDWRHQYYIQYILDNSFDPYGIGEELKEEWPKIYDIELGQFYISDKFGLNSVSYFVDMLTPESIENNSAAAKALADITISKIGQRQKVLSNTGINTIFSALPPEVFYIELGQPNTADLRTTALSQGKSIMQVSSDLAQQIAIGTVKNSAFDNIRAMLNEVLGYSESISLITLPIYDLEPNTRIRVRSPEANIGRWIEDENGNKEFVGVDFMVKTISLPLAPGEVSTITATRIIERI